MWEWPIKVLVILSVCGDFYGLSYLRDCICRFCLCVWILMGIFICEIEFVSGENCFCGFHLYVGIFMGIFIGEIVFM